MRLKYHCFHFLVLYQNLGLLSLSNNFYEVRDREGACEHFEIRDREGACEHFEIRDREGACEHFEIRDREGACEHFEMVLN